MSTPSIDFWPYLTTLWFGSPTTEGDTFDALYRMVMFLRNDDPYIELITMWGDRSRMSSDLHDKDEIRRVLQCGMEGYPWARPISPGVWDHFKGGVYAVHGRVLWTGPEGGEVVIYTSMVFGTTHARLVSVWNEIVRWPDGAYRTRFVRRFDPKIEPSFKVPTPTSV